MRRNILDKEIPPIIYQNFGYNEKKKDYQVS
jgi:hypothetical protein